MMYTIQFLLCHQSLNPNINVIMSIINFYFHDNFIDILNNEFSLLSE